MNVHGYAISDNVVDIHISVGFCVARFDKQAMPEPLSVGRVTSADSHAFFMRIIYFAKIVQNRESTELFIKLYMGYYYLMDSVDKEQSICRYMDLGNLLTMFAKKKFYIRRKRKNVDAYETNLLPIKKRFVFSPVGENVPHQCCDERQNELDRKVEEFKELSNTPISCWTDIDAEDYLLWSSYTNNKYGVRIKSTIDKFVESIDCNDYDIYCGKILYKNREQTDSAGDAVWIKTPEYKGESEIRFCFKERETQSDRSEGKDYLLLPFQPSVMVKELRLSPHLSKDEFVIMTDFISGLGIERNIIKKSELWLKK